MPLQKLRFLRHGLKMLTRKKHRILFFKKMLLKSSTGWGRGGEEGERVADKNELSPSFFLQIIVYIDYCTLSPYTTCLLKLRITIYFAHE